MILGGAFLMALEGFNLDELIASLSPEERLQLQEQLGRQIQIDKITNPTEATGQKTKPPVEPNLTNDQLLVAIEYIKALLKERKTTTEIVATAARLLSTSIELGVPAVTVLINILFDLSVAVITHTCCFFSPMVFLPSLFFFCLLSIISFRISGLSFSIVL